MLRLSGLACGLALATAGVAVGQQVIQETTTTTMVPAVANPGLRRISQLIGSNVALQGNNNFGKVEDVVLNENGAPGYMVVSNGGRYAMLPWNAANIDYGRRLVNYNVAPQAVQPLFFERNAWPTSITDQQFTSRMNQAFPNAGAVRREVLRPVEGTLPGGPPAVKEKVKVKPNGDVKVKEKVR